MPTSSSAVNGRVVPRRCASASIRLNCAIESTRKCSSRSAVRIGQLHRLHDVLATDELVGEDDAPQAHAHPETHLLHRRERDAPRARRDLPREELRRHRRLAVRSEQHAGRPREVRHPREVVRKRRLFEQGHRERQIAAQHVPAPTADVGDRAGRSAVRVALEACVERRRFDGFNVDHVRACSRVRLAMPSRPSRSLSGRSLARAWECAASC